MTFRLETSGITGEVRQLFNKATAADGVAPVSDGVAHAVAAGEPAVAAFAAEAPDAVVGFGAAVPLGDRWAAEFVVDPVFRRRGLGRLLAVTLTDRVRAAGTWGVTWPWSHGDSDAAAHLAEEFGYTRSRVLLQLFTDRVDDPGFVLPGEPAGAGAAGSTGEDNSVRIRTFRPGDEQRWMEINNAAFSWHPEQSNQTLDDYRAIVSAPDFDPAGVFFAEQAGHIIGFHHTKIHRDHPSGLTVGEVYVIGVDPKAHSRGVGTALMLAGMRHLIEAGAQRLELYVESDNDAATHLYNKLGFTNQVRHVSYAPRTQPSTAAGEGVESAATTSGMDK